MKQRKTTKKRIVKIDILVRKEVKEFGLIIDHLGHIWRPPFKSSDGRVWRLKELQVFTHKTYHAIQIKNRIISLDRIINNCVDVKYKKRFEIDFDNVPDEMKYLIAGDVESLDTKPIK